MTDHEHEHEHEHEHHEAAMSPEEYVSAYRAAKDEWMRKDPSSPLPEASRAGFVGLQYYPFNEKYLLTLTLDRDVSSDPVTMETSTGDKQEYHRLGKISFEAEGQPAQLTIYRSETGSLFLPLRDATSGGETYGAGRYVEPDLLDEDRVLADFNQLYNPFCAYNEHFSCPLPPIENWLQVPVRAGEKVPLS